MKTPAFTNQFNRDIKKCEKQGKNLIKIKAVMFDLIVESPLSAKLSDHALAGNWKGHRECHIEPDWLLIYLYAGEEVRFVRTGTHSELFE
jgi:mRNA interferase YafQ